MTSPQAASAGSAGPAARRVAGGKGVANALAMATTSDAAPWSIAPLPRERGCQRSPHVRHVRRKRHPRRRRPIHRPPATVRGIVGTSFAATIHVGPMRNRANMTLTYYPYPCTSLPPDARRGTVRCRRLDGHTLTCRLHVPIQTRSDSSVALSHSRYNHNANKRCKE